MLDEKLLQQRLEQFNPEPLVDLSENLNSTEIERNSLTEDEKTIDLAKVNFLDLLNNEYIKNSCENIIRKYGVGTCGPRAFYGTTDVHLDLETRIAEFLGMEASIVYSYGFVAISSSIAAYCKRSDVVFIDEKSNIGIIQGLQCARSKIVYFKHNDPVDLREQLEKITKDEKGRKSRKFLIVEGVSWATGKLLPLDEFLTVAEDYKMRIFLEESYSIGVYGEHGKGLTEYFNIDPTRLDMIIATLECAIGSIGGFCAGSETVIEHQTLSGSGYIFSASLPTFLVQACIDAIDIIQDNPNTIKTLGKLATEFQNFLEETCHFKVESDTLSALKVFTIHDDDQHKAKEKKVHKFCQEKGVQFISSDNGLVINLNVSLYTDKSRLERVYNVLKEVSAL